MAIVNSAKSKRIVRSRKLSPAVTPIIQNLERRVLFSSTLADWTFETTQPTTAGPLSPEVGSGAATGSHVGVSMYSSPAGNGSAHSFSSNTWAVGDYYQFKTSSTASSGLSVSFDQTSSTTGPGQFQLQYSTDGTNFTNAGSAYAVLGNGTSPNASWTATTAVPAYTSTFNLSSVTALNNQANIYFRLTDASTTSAAGGTTAATGTDRVDNFAVNATTALAVSTVTVSPTSLATANASPTTLTATITDTGTNPSVSFYRETTNGTENPVAGGDTLLTGTAGGSGNTFTLSGISTTGLTTGSYTYYAVASDSGTTTSSPTATQVIGSPSIASLTASPASDPATSAATLTAVTVAAGSTSDPIKNVTFYAELSSGTMSPGVNDYKLGTITTGTVVGSNTNYVLSYTPAATPATGFSSLAASSTPYTIYAVATSNAGVTSNAPTASFTVTSSTITLSQAAYNTGTVPAGGENLVITATRTGDITNSTSLKFSTADGTAAQLPADGLATDATAPGAYTSVTSGPVSFAANSATTTFTVHIAQPSSTQNEDSLFTVTLNSPATGYTIATAAGAATAGVGYVLIDETPKAFNAGNSANDDVVIEQSGNNVTTAQIGESNAAYLDEYGPNGGALIQSFPLPTQQTVAQVTSNLGSADGNLPIQTDTSSSDIFPTLTQSGQYIVVAGGQTGSANQWVDTGLVGDSTSGSGLTIDTKNSVNYGTGASITGGIRGVASKDGGLIYYVYSSGSGLYSADGIAGQTDSNTLSNHTPDTANQAPNLVPATGSKGNLRGVALDANGDPFITASTGGLLFSEVVAGASLPLSASALNDVGFNTGTTGQTSSISGPFQFAFASEGAEDDTLYISDSGSSPSQIKKFSLVSTANHSVPVSAIAQYNADASSSTPPGIWIPEGSINLPASTEVEGLALDQTSPTNVQIYATVDAGFDTTGTYANQSLLYSLTDTLSANGPTSISNKGSTLGAPLESLPAATSTISEFHGATIAPSALTTPTLTVAPGSTTATAQNETIANGQPVTLTAYATGTPTPTVQWYSEAPGTTTFYPVTAGAGSANSYNSASGTFYTYSFTASDALNGTKYEAIFSNSQGNSDPAVTGSASALASSGYSNPTANQVSTLTVVDQPAISSLTANGFTGHAGGAITGGTAVTINGTNFAAGDTVMLDGQTITPSPSNITSTAITFVTPAATETTTTTKDVQVNSNGVAGTSATNANDLFTYATAPTVDSTITPSTGTEHGGTSVTINGTGFFSGGSVTFGLAGAAASFQVVSPTQIIAVSPPAQSPEAATETVDVTVTTPSGTAGASQTSATSNADKFTYSLTTVAQADNSTDGTIVSLDSNPIVTAILQTPNDAADPNATVNYEFLIDDGSGINPATGLATTADSILVNASPASLGSYTPTVGDELKITGTFKYTNGAIFIPELTTITSVMKVSPGNNLPADFNPTIHAADIQATNSRFSPYAGQLVTITGVNVSNVPAGEKFPTGAGNDGGTTTTPWYITDSSNSSVSPNTANNTPGLYDYANSFSAAYDNLSGQTIPTTNATFTGLVNYDFGDPIEFLPMSLPGAVEHFAYTLTSGGPAGSALASDAQTATTTKNDGFSQVNRGDSITVNLTRTETLSGDTGTVNVVLTPDSGVAGPDFSTTAAGATTTAGIITVPVTFAPGVNTASITVTTAGSLPGDKLFSISLAKPVATPPAGSTATYNVTVTSAPTTIVIHDNVTPNTYSDFASDSSGTYTSEISSINPNGNTVSTSSVSVEGSSRFDTGVSQEGYLIQTFNDSAFDPTDVLDTDASGTNHKTVESIDGVEFEARLTGFQRPGTLNVYISDSNAYQIGNTQSGAYPISSLGFQTDTSNTDGSSDGVGGTPNANNKNDISSAPNLGNLYLLGSLNWTADSTAGSTSTYITGAETPFNLNNLDPVGTYLLAKELDTGVPITVVITPGSANVAATFSGFSTSNNYSAIEPNLRVDYSTDLPTWTTAPVVSNVSTAVFIRNEAINSNTLYVTAADTISADPGSDLPNIVDYFAGSVIQFTPTLASTTTASRLTPTDFHIAGLTLAGGAEAEVTALDTTAVAKNSNVADHATDHDVLVVGSLNATAAPTFSIDASSKLDLADNDMIIHDGDLTTVQNLAEEGRAPSSGAPGQADGTWTGNGLTSSVAAGINAADFAEFVDLGVVKNADLQGADGQLPSWTSGGNSEPLNGNDIIVKYTYFGDACLEGIIGDDNVGAVDAFYSDTKPVPSKDYWAYGAFEGNGLDNDDSVGAVDGYYNQLPAL